MLQLLPSSIFSNERTGSDFGFDDLSRKLAGLPDGHPFLPPHFILLATPTSYFVYDATDGQDGLRIAGDNLEEVYNGLGDWRWADSSEDPWDFVKQEKYVPPDFPQYYRQENGNFGAWGWSEYSREEYPGKTRSGLVQSLWDLIVRSFKR